MSPRVRAWLGVWAAATALALLLAVSTSLTYIATGRPGSWGFSLTRSLADWWLWALVTPAIGVLARRWPLDGARRLPHVAIHLAVGLTVAAIKTIVDRVLLGWLTGIWTYLLVSTVASQFLIYACLVAAAHGVVWHRRSREREQLEGRLAEARLQLLTMQLQPHFLFNTLNTIAELLHEDQDAADAMIVGLSDLLRMTLDHGDSREVTLAAELNLARTYLSIQRARFGARLDVTEAVDPGTFEARVPLLLLQPILENAIRHGVASRSAGGRIEISIRRSGDRLLIDVADDGDGKDAEGARAGRGIGLANTRARLEEMYGAGCRLDLVRDGGRTLVALDLPFTSGERAR